MKSSPSFESVSSFASPAEGGRRLDFRPSQILIPRQSQMIPPAIGHLDAEPDVGRQPFGDLLHDLPDVTFAGWVERLDVEPPHQDL
jgi:hypothetical protein